MPVYVDVSAAVHGRAGLGRYARTLAETLVARYPGEIAIFYNRDRAARPVESLRDVPARTVPLGYKPWRMAVWLGQLARLSFRRLLPGAVLYHATEHLLMPLRGVPTVLTVHDLIYRLFPRHHKRLNYWFLNAAMPLFVARADHIVAISQATKRDLVQHYGIDPEKVTVIYEAAAPRFQPMSAAAVAAARARYHLPEHFMLHVGTIEPRKNLARVLAALEQLRAEGLDLALVIVGGKGWLYDDFFARLAESPARQAVVLPGYVPDEDLPAVYGAADLVVMASVYEGFGLPVLEGMACGTPVAASRMSSLPELGGDAALYFDPYDVPAMAAVIRRICRESGLAEMLRARGLAQAARFSWEQAADETMALYRRLIAAL